jgi:hypothetical protein
LTVTLKKGREFNIETVCCVCLFSNWARGCCKVFLIYCF